MEKVKDGLGHSLNSKHSRVKIWNLKNIFFIRWWYERDYPQMLLLSKTGGIRIV